MGDVTVAAALGIALGASANSITISAEDSYADGDLCYIDLADIYLDTSVNANKVNVIYTLASHVN